MLLNHSSIKLYSLALLQSARSQYTSETKLWILRTAFRITSAKSREKNDVFPERVLRHRPKEPEKESLVSLLQFADLILKPEPVLNIPLRSVGGRTIFCMFVWLLFGLFPLTSFLVYHQYAFKTLNSLLFPNEALHTAFITKCSILSELFYKLDLCRYGSFSCVTLNYEPWVRQRNCFLNSYRGNFLYNFSLLMVFFQM